jgi:hypothetical protein
LQVGALHTPEFKNAPHEFFTVQMTSFWMKLESSYSIRDYSASDIGFL